MIASRKIGEAVMLDADPLIGEPDHWKLSTRPDGWNRERKLDRGELPFQDIINPGPWD